MVKLQVQIPNELYRRAKQAAAEREWSVAEVVRRGLEYIKQANPPGRTAGTKWRLPPAHGLGPFLAAEDKWTELSHQG